MKIHITLTEAAQDDACVQRAVLAGLRHAGAQDLNLALVDYGVVTAEVPPEQLAVIEQLPGVAEVEPDGEVRAL